MKKTIFLFGVLLFLIPSLSLAQQYPTKPISYLVNRAPGGTQDLASRALVKAAEKFLGQPFIISNNGGGGGSVAMGILAKERPDGYHLAGHSTTALISIPQMRKTPYKLEDFVPICRFGVPQNGICVKSDSTWKTLKEFVDYAKSNPGKVNYSTGGAGTSYHLAMEYIAKQEGIKWTHVPFPGSMPALTALLGGHVPIQSGSTEFIPYVQAGTLRLLAVQGEERMKKFPNVPTMRELGYDYVSDVIFMISAPKGIPPLILKKLEEAFRKATEDPEFIQVMDKIDIDVSYRNSAETKKFLEEAYPRLGHMIKELKLPTEMDVK